MQQEELQDSPERRLDLGCRVPSCQQLRQQGAALAARTGEPSAAADRDKVQQEGPTLLQMNELSCPHADRLDMGRSANCQNGHG